MKKIFIISTALIAMIVYPNVRHAYGNVYNAASAVAIAFLSRPDTPNAVSLSINSSGASTTSALTAGKYYRVHCTTQAHYDIGSSASVTTSDPIMGINNEFIFQALSGDKFSARGYSTSGVCTLVPVA